MTIVSQDSQSNVYRAIVDANRRKILGLLREVDEWLGRCRELREDRLDRLDRLGDYLDARKKE